VPLKVALIGCGFIGRFHSAALRNIVRTGLLPISYEAVCDIDESRARAFANAAGVPRIHVDPSEVIEAPDIDVVYICTPTVTHKPLVLAAAERGKHVFCEKPLAANLSDVEEMTAVVKRAGVKAGVGLVLRHSPILTVLKSLMDDPTLGRLMVIVFRDDQFFPISGHYNSDWRKDKAIVGSGTLLEHSIHDVDILRWFGGEIRRVRGVVRNYAGYEGVEDLALAHIEFASGADAELVSVWHSVLGRPSTRRIEVFMEKAIFWVDHDYLGPIHFQTHAQNAQMLGEEQVRRRYLEMVGLTGAPFEETLRYSFEDYLFLRAIIEGGEPFPGFDTALEVHRVVDAIYRSAASGGEAVQP
jgi:predicted dehydrogenase